MIRLVDAGDAECGSNSASHCKADGCRRTSELDASDDCCHSDSGSDGDATGCRSSVNSANSRPRCDGCRPTSELDASDDWCDGCRRTSELDASDDYCHSDSGSNGDAMGFFSSHCSLRSVCN